MPLTKLVISILLCRGNLTLQMTKSVPLCWLSLGALSTVNITVEISAISDCKSCGGRSSWYTQTTAAHWLIQLLCSGDGANGDFSMSQNKAWHPQKKLLASAIWCAHGEWWSSGAAEQKLQLQRPVSVLLVKEEVESSEGSSVKKGKQFLTKF